MDVVVSDRRFTTGRETSRTRLKKWKWFLSQKPVCTSTTWPATHLIWLPWPPSTPLETDRRATPVGLGPGSLVGSHGSLISSYQSNKQQNQSLPDLIGILWSPPYLPSFVSAAPSQPSFLSFSEVTGGSVNVSWGPPLTPNGQVEGYRVMYQPTAPVQGLHTLM